MIMKQQDEDFVDAWIEDNEDYEIAKQLVLESEILLKEELKRRRRALLLNAFYWFFGLLIGFSIGVSITHLIQIGAL